MDICYYLQAKVTDELKRLETRKKNMSKERVALLSVKDEDGWIFRIDVISFWTDQGGRNIRYLNKKKMSLEAALRAAIAKFRKTSREEVSMGGKMEQIYISVSLPHGSSFISLPKEFWEEIAKKYVDRVY